MDFLIQGFVQGLGLIWAMDEETTNIVITTLQLTGLSMLFILALGLPLGFLLGYFDFPGKRAVRTFVDTLLAMPTVVVGLLVYAFICNAGPLRKYELLFTIQGMQMALERGTDCILVSIEAAGLIIKARVTKDKIAAEGITPSAEVWLSFPADKLRWL